MEKGRHEEEDQYYDSSAARASTIGHQTSDHEETQYIINEIVYYHGLDLIGLLKTYADHPHIKDETKLVAQIFEKREVIEDLVGFLASPERTVAKYELSQEEGRRFVSLARGFLHQNYEFYEHFFLQVDEGVLDHKIWFQFLHNKVNQIYHSSLGYLADVFLPFVKYEYSTSSRVTEYFEKKYNSQRSILVISQFSEELIGRLLKFTHLEAIFKIIFHIVLASLQEQEWKMSLNLLRLLCQSSVEANCTLDSHIENVYLMLKDVSNNIQKDINNTIFAFTDAFVQSNLVEASINRIRTLFASSTSLESIKILEPHEQIILEFNLKVLAEVVNIYYLLRKIGIDYMAHQMVKLRTSMLQIFNAMDEMMLLLRQIQSKTIKFSNGENIKASFLYRFQFLNLLKVCLTIVKEYGETCKELQSKIDRSLILEFVTRCLSENRWNNIIHCQIEKVVCLAVSPELFKAKNMSVQRFLKFLVETFSNKKYMFLNSAKMINQGDIHAIYFISRKITVELDRTPGIVDISNEYDFWKQFVLNVLQKYENNNERLSKISSELDYESTDRWDGDLRVQIDELASIKEIVKKVDVNQKWSNKKENSNEHVIPRAGSASNLNKPKIVHQKSEKVGSPIIHKSTVAIKKLKSIDSDDNKPEEGSEHATSTKKIPKKIESLPSDFQEMELIYASSHSDSEVADEEECARKLDFKH